MVDTYLFFVEQPRTGVQHLVDQVGLRREHHPAAFVERGVLVLVSLFFRHLVPAVLQYVEPLDIGVIAHLLGIWLIVRQTDALQFPLSVLSVLVVSYLLLLSVCCLFLIFFIRSFFIFILSLPWTKA